METLFDFLLLPAEQYQRILDLVKPIADMKAVRFISLVIKYSFIDPMAKEFIEDLGYDGIIAKTIGYAIGISLSVCVLLSVIFDTKSNNISATLSIIVWVATRMGIVQSEFKAKRKSDSITESLNRAEHNYNQERIKAEQERIKAEQERIKAEQRHKELINKINALTAMKDGDQSEAAIQYRNDVFEECKTEIIHDVAHSFKTAIDTAIDASIQSAVGSIVDEKISKFDIMEHFDPREYEQTLASHDKPIA